MRIMIDTNILLSAALFKSLNPARSIGIALSQGNVLLLSAYIIDEARTVIKRKWPSRQRTFEDFLHSANFETIEADAITLGLFEIRDPMDYPILYLAMEGRADILVTGDKDFLDVKIERPSIMTPADFVARFS